VKFEVTGSFRADRKRLSARERALVAEALPAFVAACERFARDASSAWPAGLRIMDVEGAAGVIEITFSFAGPDLRATFEWLQIGGELAVRWRRIGGHRIFKSP
jgi:hypothetical protein